MENKREEKEIELRLMLIQILRNQKDIMHYLGKSLNGFFEYRIEETRRFI